jgi:chromosome segregation ATPase
MRTTTGLSKAEAKAKYQALEDKRDKMVEALQKAHEKTDKIRKQIYELDQEIKVAYKNWKRTW